MLYRHMLTALKNYGLFTSNKQAANNTKALLALSALLFITCILVLLSWRQII